jgi:hypothetical protein
MLTVLLLHVLCVVAVQSLYLWQLMHCCTQDLSMLFVQAPCLPVEIHNCSMTERYNGQHFCECLLNSSLAPASEHPSTTLVHPACRDILPVRVEGFPEEHIKATPPTW